MTAQEAYDEQRRAGLESCREDMEKSYFGLDLHFDAAEIARQKRMRLSYEPVWLTEESQEREPVDLTDEQLCDLLKVVNNLAKA